MTGGNAILAGIVLLVLPTLLYIWVVWLADKNEKEPLVDILLALVAGAILAPAIVFSVERGLGVPDSIYPAKLAQLPFGDPNLGGAAIEEIAKALVVLGLFVILPREFDNVMDGIVYGTVVGAGFVLAENLVYVIDLIRLQEAVRLSSGFFVPILLGGLSHCVFSGIFGASLGLIREGAVPPYKIAWAPVAGLMLAILYHMTYLVIGPISGQSMVLAVVAAAADWAGVVFLVFVVLWAWQHEARIIHAMLADELGTGAVTPGELALLGTTGARAANELHALSVGGLQTYQLARALHQAQVELAFRKWHLLNEERLKGDQRDTDEQAYRAQIADLRARLDAILARRVQHGGQA